MDGHICHAEEEQWEIVSNFLFVECYDAHSCDKITCY